MGRNKNDFSRGLFHGTDYPFLPGEHVNPGKDGIAWASTNREVAQSYGRHLFEVEPAADIQRHPGAAKEFGIHHSNIGYKVIRQVED